MRWLISLLLTGLLFAEEGTLNQHVITEFDGYISNIAPNKAEAKKATGGQNIFLDEKSAVTCIGGFDYQSTVPGTGTILSGFVFETESGEEWIIAQRGQYIYKSIDGITWSAAINSNYPLTNNVSCGYASFQNELWITNGQNYVLIYDGADSVQYREIPRFKYLLSHYGTIWGANTIDNPSIVWWGSYDKNLKTSDGWEILNSVYIDKDARSEITGLYILQGKVIVGKNDSIWGLVGVPGEDLYIVQYSGVHGLAKQQAGLVHNDILYFNKINSSIWAFDGSQFQQIDRAIEDQTKNIRLNKGGEVYYLQTDVNEFSKGKYTNVVSSGNPYGVPGTIMPKINQFIWTTDKTLLPDEQQANSYNLLTGSKIVNGGFVDILLGEGITIDISSATEFVRYDYSPEGMENKKPSKDIMTYIKNSTLYWGGNDFYYHINDGTPNPMKAAGYMGDTDTDYLESIASILMTHRKESGKYRTQMAYLEFELDQSTTIKKMRVKLDAVNNNPSYAYQYFIIVKILLLERDSKRVASELEEVRYEHPIHYYNQPEPPVVSKISIDKDIYINPYYQNIAIVAYMVPAGLNEKTWFESELRLYNVQFYTK